MSRTSRERPKDLAPEPWPECPSGDPLGEFGRQFVISLRGAIGDRSVRSVAAAAGLNPQTRWNVLAGETWPDLATIGKLQISLGASLL